MAAGATRAIFSDTETSTGNTFTAGAIDLGIDNHGYMDGNECVNVGTEQEPNYEWQGDSPYPVPGTPCSDTWTLDYDLSHDANGEPETHQFFNFNDVKPGDWGEDTISLHVNNNDSYLCSDVTLTSNNDNGLTGPEQKDGDTTGGDGEGELANAITFIWWADDGDNVLESDENVINTGTLGQLGVGNTVTVPLADSETNIWGESVLPGDSTRYIAKAWCFGDMTVNKVTQDEETDGSVNNPKIDPGFTCNGAPFDNKTQTDSMTADIDFRAVQSRNNGSFVCEPPVQREVGTLTIEKVLINDSETGTATSTDDFTFDVSGSGVNETNLPSGSSIVVPVGNYTITENGPGGYATTYSESCTGGVATVSANTETVCTITNDDLPPENGTLTLDKQVSISSVGLVISTTDFVFQIYSGGSLVATTTDMNSVALPPGSYEVTEKYVGNTPFNYTTFFSGACSNTAPTSTVSVSAGLDSFCTVINSEHIQ